MELSFLIPAAHEEFLNQTIDDILAHSSDKSEVLVGLDGYWPYVPINDHPRVKIFHVTESIGQRAMTNQLARLSKAKYVAKIDAHCALDENFDTKMLEFFKEHGEDVVAVPIMRNLHVFDWVCKCGWRTYQKRTPPRCGWVVDKSGKEFQEGKGCGGSELYKEIIWNPKPRPESTSYCFDSEPHFQYFSGYKRTDEYKKTAEKGYNESMSLQGSFFMATRENYWKWELNDETLGNWGNQGIEVALSAWLSGGRVLCNHKTWYAHLFRTQGGDFGFPWSPTEEDIQKTKKNVWDKFINMKHPTQKYPVSWLLEKFWPVKGWTQEDLDKLK